MDELGAVTRPTVQLITRRAMQIQILSLLTPLMALLFASLFTYIWARDRSNKSILGYAFGYWVLVASFALVIMVFEGKSAIASVGLHLLATSGACAILWGTAHRVGQTSPLIAYAVIAAVGSVFVYASALSETSYVLVMAQNGSTAFIFGLGALVLWQAGSQRMTDRALMWVIALISAHGFIRPLHAMMVDGRYESLSYGSSEVQALNVVIMGILSAAMAIIILANVVLDQSEKNQREATKDALTGLPNRGAFEPLVKLLIERSAIERVPASLIVGDIDHFKQINDRFGHMAGDGVIQSFGELIASKIRPGDLAGRIGGEEFCIVAWNCGEDGACALAERLRADFAQRRYDALPKDQSISASFGVAEVRFGSSYAQTFERADAAMYRAKRGGRNQVMGDIGGSFTKVDDCAGDDKSAQIVPFVSRCRDGRS